jgi:hypothetical protein
MCLTGGQELTIPAEGNHVNDLEAAAEKAELTGQISSFMVWLGEGRKLTQTGRIGLADARHLVEVLGTGDKIDPQIGDRVFKTTSSEQLPHLSRIVEWMKAARLIRVTGTRLVPVKTNAALTSRPLDLVLALLKAYPRLGKPLFPRNTWRQSLVGDEFAEIGPALLTKLLASQGPSRMDDLKQTAFEEIAARYLLDRQPAADEDSASHDRRGRHDRHRGPRHPRCRGGRPGQGDGAAHRSRPTQRWRQSDPSRCRAWSAGRPRGY